MAANPQALFDSFDDAMLMIAADGIIRATNQAATVLFPVILGKRLAVEEIQVQVAAAARGYVRLPMEFVIDAPRQPSRRDRLRVKMMESPLGSGYLLVIKNITEAERFETIVGNFANLIAAELEQPLARFTAELNGLLAEAVPDGEIRARLSGEAAQAIGHGCEIATRMQQLATFAQVFARAPILDSERIPVLELISALLVRVGPLLKRYDIKFHMAGLTEELPVIYGSSDWLVEALYGYIEYTVRHCRIRSDLELNARPYGNFVSLQIRNRGRGLPKHLETRSFLPFGNVAATKPDGQPETALGLGLPLCKRIVELHRGHMKIDEEDGEVLAFDLELPAGAPAECSNGQMDVEQARRYAEDLTRLMQRQRAAAQPR